MQPIFVKGIKGFKQSRCRLASVPFTMFIFLLTLYTSTPQNGQVHSNTLKQTNCLSLLDHFMGLALKRLTPFNTQDCYYFESHVMLVLHIKFWLIKKACDDVL